MGLNGLIIDNTYNDMILIGHSLGALKPSIAQKDFDFTVDGKHQIYEVDLDALGTDVVAEWNPTTTICQVTFKIVSNTGVYLFKIKSAPGTIDGNVSPYDTGAVTNSAYTVYSNGSNLYII